MIAPELSEVVTLDIYRIKDTNIFWGFDNQTQHYFVADWDKRVVISGDFDNFEETESGALEYWNSYV